MVLSVSALGQLADTIAENSRTTVSFSTEPPEKRCIPYYDRRFNLTGNPLYANSKFLFDARQGDYITRVCTNADKSVVDMAMGAEYFVDTLNSSTSGACSLASNADKILAAANCVPASSDVNCTDAFQIGSTQLYAVMWNYAVSSLTQEQKQSSKVYGPCAVNVRRLPEVVGNKCTLANVYGYTFTNQNMTTLIALSAVCLVLRVVIELLGVHAFHKELNGESKENSENPMFFKVAVDGTFGKVYLAWLWLKAGCSADAFNALPAPQEWQMKDFLLIQVRMVIVNGREFHGMPAIPFTMFQSASIHKYFSVAFSFSDVCAGNGCNLQHCRPNCQRLGLPDRQMVLVYGSRLVWRHHQGRWHDGVPNLLAMQSRSGKGRDEKG